MKSILFRSIGVSLFSLILTFSIFAEGEMTTGSKTGNGNGFAPNAATELNIKTDDKMDVKEVETNFLSWIAELLAAF